MEFLKPSAANSSPLTPLGFLEKAAIVYSNCPSIIHNTTTYTWLQTNRQCLQVASSLASMGINRNDVVSVVASNIPAMYELHFAIPMAGSILNNINICLDAHTIFVLFHHSESKLIFSSLSSRQTPKPSILILISDEDDVSSLLTIGFTTTYEIMIENGDAGFKWIQPESEWDPIVVNYTTGTISSPKGVVHILVETRRFMFRFILFVLFLDSTVLFLFYFCFLKFRRKTLPECMFIMTITSLIDWVLPKQSVYLWILTMFHANGWMFPWGIAASSSLPGRITPVLYSNVCSVEVEAVLYSNLATKEAAAAGWPDEMWGETTCAFLSLKNRDWSEKEIVEFCRERLPHFMAPKAVVFREELPKTSTGKVRKFVLREVAKSLG
ncbi:hypothetical protein UlMin_035915 [Ulmus minor]